MSCILSNPRAQDFEAQIRFKSSLFDGFPINWPYLQAMAVHDKTAEALRPRTPGVVLLPNKVKACRTASDSAASTAATACAAASLRCLSSSANCCGVSAGASVRVELVVVMLVLVVLVLVTVLLVELVWVHVVLLVVRVLLLLTLVVLLLLLVVLLLVVLLLVVLLLVVLLLVLLLLVLLLVLLVVVLVVLLLLVVVLLVLLLLLLEVLVLELVELELLLVVLLSEVLLLLEVVDVAEELLVVVLLVMVLLLLVLLLVEVLVTVVAVEPHFGAQNLKNYEKISWIHFLLPVSCERSVANAHQPLAAHEKSDPEKPTSPMTVQGWVEIPDFLLIYCTRYTNIRETILTQLVRHKEVAGFTGSWSRLLWFSSVNKLVFRGRCSLLSAWSLWTRLSLPLVQRFPGVVENKVD